MVEKPVLVLMVPLVKMSGIFFELVFLFKPFSFSTYQKGKLLFSKL